MIISVVLFFCSTAIVSSYLILNKDKIYENVYIDKMRVGGMTKTEALENIKRNYQVASMDLLWEDKIWSLNLKDINFKFKLEAAVDSAYSIGRTGNFFEDIKQIVDLKMGEEIKVKLEEVYDENKMSKFIYEIEKVINTEPQNSRIEIVNQSINISKDTIGYKVNVKKLKEDMQKSIMNRTYEDVYIPVEKLMAQFRYEELKTINSLLGEYTTSFNLNVPGRSQNIRLAASKINGIILKGDEVFSFNKSTGKRDLEDGYQIAPVIVQGELQEGVAGGVCQVSSTLFNAVLYSGLDIVERKNHSIPSSYVDKGRDATVSFGSLDFRFKNNYKTPIYLESYLSGNNLVCRVYGNVNDRKAVTIRTEVTETLKKGAESDGSGKKLQTIEKGRDGFKVATYRTISQNGVTLKNELITKSYYPPKKQVVVKKAN